ncbi:tryptophan-associated transmembrane protein [Saccharopolyspora erythraea NRRL 2338]|uniref:Uncharacterized protein n=1 Tax=Saccharopolyspora erythraea (strain ATCC 11635 / DSM 40517 / JCM 4748 / NBRC 13426 / NCIMB 8594 / NRRL 2338) TaxID=405948 RepID=A4FLL2_SACEN|nr:Trp biosynthesis-associated membrane protein [Saccharopolyspora erythraea]EQD82983.1 hypothetical protein N599_27705 [Saccharopolyspora erythraea D]PFG98576.1 tryptophan-associated transmembrane protein [Saccharopolyspora erythraea NRRL 2338]QRK88615.1 Trp biosynthesis-associated membrane protein [Saccharopolyspora erythraea]CAM04937.1 hypothetical protein SACE_5752 [Saccharopolyspora erythraea NRRL 2338]
MTTEQGSEGRPATSPRLLWSVVLLMLAAAAMLWGAGALVWVGQRYRTPLGQELTAGPAGSALRPELVPLALATLAAIAAVLATGGWLRRLIGLLVLAEGGMLVWRAVDWHLGGWFAYAGPKVPPGSVPVGGFASNPAGPLLMSAAAALLVVAGALVVSRAGRMPAMGAKYSAPGEARRESRDPDRKLWDALDEGRDPTVDKDR